MYLSGFPMIIGSFPVEYWSKEAIDPDPVRVEDKRRDPDQRCGIARQDWEGME